jgi:hypothetical protein
MTLPIPAGGQWVDRHQRRDQQPTIQLDADHDFLRLAGVVSEQPMQLGQTGDPSGTLRRPSTTPAWSSTPTWWWAPAQSPRQDHPASSLHALGEPEESGSHRMDSAPRHPIPPAVSLLTDQQGTL